MAATLAGSALLLNNPAGHTLMQEVGLRIAFHDEFIHAAQMMGRNLSFAEFQEIAPIALANYYDDMETYKEAVTRLANGSTPFCSPLQNDADGKGPLPSDQPQACHAVCGRKEHALEDCSDEDDNEPDNDTPRPIFS